MNVKKIKVVEITEGISKGVYLSDEKHRYFLAKIIPYDRTEKEVLQIANLFSKAPEMLEMLIAIVTEKEGYLLDKADFREIEQLIKDATEI
jgi:hypothetical protein